jgi:protein-S-isoprenylcysteine O-methyltransferase Ste14
VWAGENVELLSTNELGERIPAFPAISDNDLIYRTDSQFRCIGRDRGTLLGPPRESYAVVVRTMNHFLLAILWIVWCAIHSSMISITATDFFKRRLGTHYRFYRLFFNLVAVATIIPVILYAQCIESHVLFRLEGILIVVQVLLLVLAGLLIIAGARHYDMLQFLGLRQIMTGASHGTLTENGQLCTSGILGVTRHPWYLATILLIWASSRSFTTSSLVTNAVLSVYLVVGTILEERKLSVEIGEGYRDFQERVSMLFPFKWLSRWGSTPDG